MKRLLLNAVGLFGVIGLLMCLFNRRHSQQVNEARQFYNRTNDIKKTIRLYPNTPIDSITKGQ
jgi:hypothetical protein